MLLLLLLFMTSDPDSASLVYVRYDSTNQPLSGLPTNLLSQCATACEKTKGCAGFPIPSEDCATLFSPLPLAPTVISFARTTSALGTCPAGSKQFFKFGKRDETSPASNPERSTSSVPSDTPASSLASTTTASQQERGSSEHGGGLATSTVKTSGADHTSTASGGIETTSWMMTASQTSEATGGAQSTATTLPWTPIFEEPVEVNSTNTPSSMSSSVLSHSSSTTVFSLTSTASTGWVTSPSTAAQINSPSPTTSYTIGITSTARSSTVEPSSSKVTSSQLRETSPSTITPVSEATSTLTTTMTTGTSGSSTSTLMISPISTVVSTKLTSTSTDTSTTVTTVGSSASTTTSPTRTATDPVTTASSTTATPTTRTASTEPPTTASTATSTLFSTSTIRSTQSSTTLSSTTTTPSTTTTSVSTTMPSATTTPTATTSTSTTTVTTSTASTTTTMPNALDNFTFVDVPGSNVSCFYEVRSHGRFSTNGLCAMKGSDPCKKEGLVSVFGSCAGTRALTVVDPTRCVSTLMYSVSTLCVPWEAMFVDKINPAASGNATSQNCPATGAGLAVASVCTPNPLSVTMLTGRFTDNQVSYCPADPRYSIPSCAQSGGFIGWLRTSAGSCEANDFFLNMGAAPCAAHSMLVAGSGGSRCIGWDSGSTTTPFNPSLTQGSSWYVWNGTLPNALYDGTIMGRLLSYEEYMVLPRVLVTPTA